MDLDRTCGAWASFLFLQDFENVSKHALGSLSKGKFDVVQPVVRDAQVEDSHCQALANGLLVSLAIEKVTDLEVVTDLLLLLISSRMYGSQARVVMSWMLLQLGVRKSLHSMCFSKR